MAQLIFNTKRWIEVALVNFCVVSLAGVTLRYKINFALPSVNQKDLLYAHSHFAFTGWVTLVLMTLMVHYLQRRKLLTNYNKYHAVLAANCVIAYVMFISFFLTGYSVYSISLSITSILISFVFVAFYWLDLRKVHDHSKAQRWFKGGMVLWVISSLGAFSLAYLMANHIMIQDLYFAAVYFFLHFQYNGWFLFVCMGLLSSFLFNREFYRAIPISKRLFRIMAITVGPSYLLSILWLDLPKALQVIADVAGILQLIVFIYFFQLFKFVRKYALESMTLTTRYIWIMAAAAFMLKILLQMLSIIPFLSHYAFGYRPVIIGYLHLSFIGVTSFFILGFANEVLRRSHRRINRAGLLVFVIGFLVQELVLMMQGFEAMEVKPLPFANIILFICAVVMFIGLAWVTIGVMKSSPNIEAYQDADEVIT